MCGPAAGREAAGGQGHRAGLAPGPEEREAVVQAPQPLGRPRPPSRQCPGCWSPKPPSRRDRRDRTSPRGHRDLEPEAEPHPGGGPGGGCRRPLCSQPPRCSCIWDTAGGGAEAPEGPQRRALARSGAHDEAAGPGRAAGRGITSKAATLSVDWDAGHKMVPRAHGPAPDAPSVRRCGGPSARMRALPSGARAPATPPVPAHARRGATPPRGPAQRLCLLRTWRGARVSSCKAGSAVPRARRPRSPRPPHCLPENRGRGRARVAGRCAGRRRAGLPGLPPGPHPTQPAGRGARGRVPGVAASRPAARAPARKRLSRRASPLFADCTCPRINPDKPGRWRASCQERDPPSRLRPTALHGRDHPPPSPGTCRQALGFSALGPTPQPHRPRWALPGHLPRTPLTSPVCGSWPQLPTTCQLCPPAGMDAGAPAWGQQAPTVLPT